MHVALRRAQFLVTGELLNRSGRCALHREMRTERVPQNVHALAAARLTSPSRPRVRALFALTNACFCDVIAIASTHR